MSPWVSIYPDMVLDQGILKTSKRWKGIEKIIFIFGLNSVTQCLASFISKGICGYAKLRSACVSSDKPEYATMLSYGWLNSKLRIERYKYASWLRAAVSLSCTGEWTIFTSYGRSIVESMFTNQSNRRLMASIKMWEVHRIASSDNRLVLCTTGLWQANHTMVHPETWIHGQQRGYLMRRI